MDARDFMQGYIDDVYSARDAAAAARYIADPCLRHEPGGLVTMSLADNMARIAAFFERFARADFVNRLLTSDGEHITACWEATIGDGQVLSGIEVFRVVDGRIVETWNAATAPAAWG